MSEPAVRLASARGEPPYSEGPLARRLLARVGQLGPVTQAAVPAIYAWGVTVAPVAWRPGAPLVLRSAGALAPCVLVGASLIEGRARFLAQKLTIWGMVLSSTAVWLLGPSSYVRVHFDATRAVVGMLAWGLFAFAIASPSAAPSSMRRATPLEERRSDPTRVTVYEFGRERLLCVGALGAMLMLVPLGWSIQTPERGVLVRVVTLAASLSLLDAATCLATSSRETRAPLQRRGKGRRAVPWLVLFGILALGGIVACWSGL